MGSRLKMTRLLMERKEMDYNVTNLEQNALCLICISRVFALQIYKLSPRF